MTSDAAITFASAKEAEVQFLQNDAWRKEGIGDFMSGKYRSGLGGHEGKK